MSNIKSSKNISSTIVIWQTIVQKTILSAQKYKLLDIYGANELTICITALENIYAALQQLNKDDTAVMDRIAAIKTELILILKNFGTESFADLVTALVGDEYVTEHFATIANSMTDKFNILALCVHPISFKVLPWLKV